MSLVLFDHECDICGHIFEELVDRDGASPSCPECTSYSTHRLLSPLRLDPRLGVSRDFPSMADKWEKNRKQHQRIEERRNREHGDQRPPAT